MIHNMPFSSQTECRAVVSTTCRRYVLLTAIVVSYAQSIITSYPKLNFGTLLQWQEHTQRDLTSNSFHLSFIQNTAALSSTCPQPVFMFGLRAMGRGIFRRLLLLSENNINPSYTVMPAQITGWYDKYQGMDASYLFIVILCVKNKRIWIQNIPWWY